MSNERYLVTARKYRPATFSELVSQEHVSETLKNAIRLDRLAHAYLFSGPRGVGKTTAARILAKAINCQTPLAEREDGAEPCRTCESCRTFEEGRNLNVIEIDAASNNKVDDIRELRETVRVPPQGAKKKIYILDEVHMLSSGAFNALLKTLEEPPPHVLFIFATTEPHKVLPTILSRCQRFDFRRIAVEEIVGRLHEIIAQENISADEESLMLIARKGDGALRDALSIFDQAVSLCGTDLRYAELRDALGVVDTDLFFDATTNVTARDSAAMLRLVDTLVRRGYDLQEFLAGFEEHLRNLLVVSSTGQTDLIEATEAVRERYREAARVFSEGDLLRLLMIAGETEEALKHAAQPRLKMELALLKMAALERAADLRAVIRQIGKLEELAKRGQLAVPATAEPAPAYAAPPVTAGPAPTQPKTPPEPPASRDTPPDPPAPPPPAPAPSAPAPSAPAGQGMGVFTPPALKRSPQAPKSAPPSSPQQAPSTGSGQRSQASAVVDTPTLAPDTVAALPQPGVDVHFGISLGAVRAVWDAVVADVRAASIRVGAMLQQARPDGVERGVLQFAVPDDFFEKHLRTERALVVQVLEKHLGHAAPPIEFIVRAGDPSGDGAETPAALDPFEHLKKMRQENPLVRAIFEQFGGEIVYDR